MSPPFSRSRLPTRPGRGAAALLAFAALLALALPRSGRAGGGDPPVLAALMDDGGWTLLTTADEGVQVYKKAVPGQKLLGWKGVKTTSAPPDTLFNAILDIDNGARVDPKRIPLLESQVLATRPDGVDFFQVLNVPALLASDRYWFCRTFIQRDVGGVKGHHVQKWVGLDAASAHPAKYAYVQQKYSGAIQTVQNYGAWELVPRHGGLTQVAYRVFSDPGGSIPSGAQNFATRTTLPDTINAFDRLARKRAGL